MRAIIKQIKIRRLAYLSGWVAAIAIVSAISVAWYLFSKDIERQKVSLKQAGIKVANTIDYEMTIRAYGVMSMRKSAESILNGRTEINTSIERFIEPVVQKNGYTLAALPGYQPNEIGRITGIGNIPAPGSATLSEIKMSLALSPMFQTVIEHNVETPWVYYISANKFLYLYPQVSINDFFYIDMSTRDYYRLALPKNNPSHSVYWTPVYLDDGGKGRMVTVGAPVYQGNTFRGALCVDIALSKLDWLLTGYEFPYLNMFIYGNPGGLLVKHPENAQEVSIPDLSSRSIIQQGDMLVYALPLQSVPWHLVIATSHQQMVYSALWRALPVAFIVMLLFTGLILLMALVRSWSRVHELSIRDGLTGVYNRRFFDTVTENDLSRARRNGSYTGIILLDIDLFKIYNDTFGHQAGDHVLIQVANVLRDTLKRPSDTLFRVGGEEFAIQTEASTPDQVVAVANRLQKAVAQLALAFPSSPYGVVTVSGGLYILPPKSGETIEDAYRKADQALYRAKKDGRNRLEIGH